MAAQITNDAIVVDIEIELPDGSMVWLEPDTGLNVIYGKNGSGKTSFLRAITAGKCAGTLYLQIPTYNASEVIPETFTSIYLTSLDIISRSLFKIKKSVEFLGHRRRFFEEMFLPPTPIEMWALLNLNYKRPFVAREDIPKFSRCQLTEKGKQLLTEEIKEFQKSLESKDFFDPFNETSDLEFSHNTKWIEEKIRLDNLARNAIAEINETGFVSQSVIDHHHSSFSRSIADAIHTNVIDECREIEFQLRAENAIGIEFHNHEDFSQQVQFLNRDANKILVELLGWKLQDLFERLTDTDRRSSFVYWFDPIANGYREQINQQILNEWNDLLKIFSVALSTLIDDALIAIERDSSLENSFVRFGAYFKSGIPQFAIRLPSNTPKAQDTETDKFFTHILTFLEEYPSERYSSSGLIGAMFLATIGDSPDFGNSAYPRQLRHRTTKRYLRVKHQFASEVAEAPGIVDLSRPIDLKSLASSLLDFTTIGSNFLMSPPHISNGQTCLDEGNVELPNLPRVNAMIEQASQILRSFDIGIYGIDYDIKFDYDSVRLRTQPEIKFWTTEGSQSIQFEEMSHAQQLWTTYLLNILLCNPSRDNPMIFVADEPDSGVHQSASREILEFLAALPCTSIITSHSPTSLRIDSAHLVHLSISPNGLRTISPPTQSKTVSEVATNLGVTPIELLALIKLLVVCEGDHDVAVIEGLLKHSRIPGIQQRVIVSAARGVANLQSTATCSIITEYTELNVLHIADNSNLEEIRRVADYLRNCPQGMNISRALEQSGLAELQKNASHEDRVMLNLLDAIAKRNLLGRFHLYGLCKKDIIEYLPEESFGLTDTWEKLRHDFNHFQGMRNLPFKEWLRSERSAQISSRKVKEAFSKVEELNEELSELLREIERLAKPPSIPKSRIT